MGFLTFAKAIRARRVTILYRSRAISAIVFAGALQCHHGLVGARSRSNNADVRRHLAGAS